MKRRFQKMDIFVVEDNPIYVKMITYILERNPEHRVHIFTSGAECIKNLHLNPSIICLDYHLPDIKGSEVLRRIMEFDPSISVIMVSNQNDVYTALELLRGGAKDYICKDERVKEKLISSIAYIKNQKTFLSKKHKKKTTSPKNRIEIIGNSKAIYNVKGMIDKAAIAPITVSISGETGVGKEVVAKTIHYDSSNSDKPFIAVNVSAIPKNLLESELFGYKKGAFTGANTDKKGLFEMAGKGTIFLDEIGEMEISMQAKLLRVLQEREFYQVGGTEPRKFQARIIVATHRNLKEQIDNGAFREDLYYRLLGLPIHIPPLRERREDLLLLANHFLNDFTSQHNLAEVNLSYQAEQKLLSYQFPGNIRELKAIMELAAVLSGGEEILPEHLRIDSTSKSLRIESSEMTMEDYKRSILKEYLKKYDRDIELVAQKLDISKSTIYRMMKELGRLKVA